MKFEISPAFTVLFQHLTSENFQKFDSTKPLFLLTLNILRELNILIFLCFCFDSCPSLYPLKMESAFSPLKTPGVFIDLFSGKTEAVADCKRKGRTEGRRERREEGSKDRSGGQKKGRQREKNINNNII